MTTSEPTVEPSSPKWRPIEATDRRVLGVLIEKAKTTPANYPLSLNAIKSGANQKSNRFPQMQLDDDQVEEALDRLRECGAVSFIQGDGRVQKYRHLAYDWLSVDKVELAVMAELLLRGAQTLGELRGRAARMEPIKGMSELGPLFESLQAKSLVVYLTPPGRGAVVTHNLYQPQEMEKIKREQESGPQSAPVAAVSPRPADDHIAQIQQEIAHVRATLSEFRSDTESTIETLRAEIEDMKSQLGQRGHRS